MKKEGSVHLPNGIGIRREGGVDFYTMSIDFRKFGDDDAGGICVGGVWWWGVCVDIASRKAGPPGVAGIGGIPVIYHGKEYIYLGCMPKDGIPNSDNIWNAL